MVNWKLSPVVHVKGDVAFTVPLPSAVVMPTVPPAVGKIALKPLSGYLTS